MTIETILPFAPFLAVLYVLFALVQAVRKQRQGVGAVIMAVIALVIPLAALLLTQDATTRASIASYLTLNAIIVFVGSIMVLMIERGNPARGANRSYGMLGIGLGVLIAVASLVYPLVLEPRTASAARNTSAFNASGANTSTIQNVSQSTTNTSGETSPTAEVLTAQTGLTTEALTTQLQAGNTISDLVAEHQGDLDAVVTAIISVLDTLKAEGGRRAEMLTSLGTDSSAIATQFVQGDLEERTQQLLTSIVVGGGRGFPQGGQNPPSSMPDGTVPTMNGTPGVPGGFGEPPANAPADAQQPAQAASLATAQPTESPATPTDVTIRPTVISFPSATPSPEVTQVDPNTTITPEAVVSETVATCVVTPFYNLNLREEPNTEGRVYLSIPFGTQVTAEGKTEDNWYKVTFDGQAGWVSGEYVTADLNCDSLAVVKADG